MFLVIFFLFDAMIVGRIPPTFKGGTPQKMWEFRGKFRRADDRFGWSFFRGADDEWTKDSGGVLSSRQRRRTTFWCLSLQAAFGFVQKMLDETMRSKWQSTLTWKDTNANTMSDSGCTEDKHGPCYSMRASLYGSFRQWVIWVLLFCYSLKLHVGNGRNFPWTSPCCHNFSQPFDSIWFYQAASTNIWARFWTLLYKLSRFVSVSAAC